MTLFLTIRTDSVDIYFQAGSDFGDVACCFETVRPGEELFGIKYEAFLKYGSGKMEINE